MQYYTQIPQVDPVEFKKKEYKKNLRKDSNKIGALLIISEAIALTFSLFIIVFSLFSKKSLINFGNDAFSTLESGLMSFFCFFLPGLLFCIINKRNFNEIFREFDSLISSKVVKDQKWSNFFVKKSIFSIAYYCILWYNNNI